MTDWRIESFRLATNDGTGWANVHYAKPDFQAIFIIQLQKR
jgi:hypothetical protein